MAEVDLAPREVAATADLIDTWYQALDRRPLMVGTQRWLALVTGIHVHGGDVWIQIARADDPDENLVIRVSPGTSVDRVAAAVRAWSPSGSNPWAVHVTQNFRETGDSLN